MSNDAVTQIARWHRDGCASNRKEHSSPLRKMAALRRLGEVHSEVDVTRFLQAAYAQGYTFDNGYGYSFVTFLAFTYWLHITGMTTETLCMSEDQKEFIATRLYTRELGPYLQRLVFYQALSLERREALQPLKPEEREVVVAKVRAEEDIAKEAGVMHGRDYDYIVACWGEGKDIRVCFLPSNEFFLEDPRKAPPPAVDGLLSIAVLQAECVGDVTKKVTVKDYIVGHQRLGRQCYVLLTEDWTEFLTNRRRTFAEKIMIDHKMFLIEAVKAQIGLGPNRTIICFEGWMADDGSMPEDVRQESGFLALMNVWMQSKTPRHIRRCFASDVACWDCGHGIQAVVLPRPVI